MAKANVEAVFGELEKVFSGEVIFDECLMQLGLHTAQVRKQWPHLFAALQGGAFVTVTSNAIEGVPPRVVVRGIPDPIVPVELYSYSAWSINEAQRSREGDEWNVVWDVEGAPMPVVSSSLTLRTPTHKARFIVQSYLDEMTMVLRMVGQLPLTY